MVTLGGFCAGYGQGIQTIVNATNNAVYNITHVMPNVGAFGGSAVQAYISSIVNPAYGTYWEFGVILASVGFIPIALGDKKPRAAEKTEPLLPPSSEPPLV